MAPPAASRRAVLPALMSLALIAALNFLAYLPSLHAPFVFDDGINIVENPDIIQVGLGRAKLRELLRPSLQHRRILADASFALNLRVFGEGPESFHAVNLAIHIFNAWLVFALIKGNRFSTRSPLTALFGALLWSLHPVQVQAVTYIVQRVTSLAAFFYLFSLFLWLQARVHPWRAGQVGFAAAAVLAGGIGLGCKEILATLPLAILLWEAVFLQRGKPLRERRGWLTLAAITLAGYIAALLVLGPGLRRQVADNVPVFASSWLTRLVSFPRMVGHYLSLLAFPHLSRLSLDPEWIVSQSLFRPWPTFPALLLLAAGVGVCLVLIRTRPVAAFASLFFLIALLPESLLPLDPVFDHRLYLPSAALMAAAGAGLAWPGPWRRMRLILLALTLGLLSILTYSRNRTWTDELRLWRDTVRKSPGKARPWNNLAAIYHGQGLLAPAGQAYQQASRLAPEDFFTNVNLSKLYLAQHDLPKARAAAARAWELNPQNAWSLLAMGLVEGEAGNEEQALNWYHQVWDKRPTDSSLLERLGNGLLQINRPDLAQDVFAKVLSLFPNRPGVFLLIGNSYFRQGRFAEAAAAYSEELKQVPDSPEAQNNLGMAWLRLSEFDQALAVFARAVQLAPGKGLFHANLCEVEFELGHLDRAEASCRRAVALEPSLAVGWNLLGSILLRQGRKEEAIHCLEKAGTSPGR